MPDRAESPSSLDTDVADLIWLTANGMRRVETAVAHLVDRTSDRSVPLRHSAYVEPHGTLMVVCTSGTHEITVHLERGQWHWSRPPS